MHVVQASFCAVLLLAIKQLPLIWLRCPPSVPLSACSPQGGRRFPHHELRNLTQRQAREGQVSEKAQQHPAPGSHLSMGKQAHTGLPA